MFNSSRLLFKSVRGVPSTFVRFSSTVASAVEPQITQPSNEARVEKGVADKLEAVLKEQARVSRMLKKQASAQQTIIANQGEHQNTQEEVLAALRFLRKGAPPCQSTNNAILSTGRKEKGSEKEKDKTGEAFGYGLCTALFLVGVYYIGYLDGRSSK